MTVEWNTLVILAGVFGVGASLSLWITAQFRTLEKTIYRESAKQDIKFTNCNTRIQRLELKAFGFTHSGQAAVDQG